MPWRCRRWKGTAPVKVVLATAARAGHSNLVVPEFTIQKQGSLASDIQGGGRRSGLGLGRSSGVRLRSAPPPPPTGRGILCTFGGMHTRGVCVHACHVCDHRGEGTSGEGVLGVLHPAGPRERHTMG